MDTYLSAAAAPVLPPPNLPFRPGAPLHVADHPPELELLDLRAIRLESEATTTPTSWQNPDGRGPQFQRMTRTTITLLPPPAGLRRKCTIPITLVAEKRVYYSDREPMETYTSHVFGPGKADLAFGFAWSFDLAMAGLKMQEIAAQIMRQRQLPKMDPILYQNLDLSDGQREMLTGHPVFRQMARPRPRDLSSLVEVVPARRGETEPGTHRYKVNLAYLKTLIREGFYDQAAA